MSEISEKTISPDNAYERIIQLIDDRLIEMEHGYETPSLEDLLRLKAAAKDDQPVSMFFLIVLNRLMAFCQDTVTDETEYRLITGFLQRFQQAMETDLLTMMSGLKDGLGLPPLSQSLD